MSFILNFLRPSKFKDFDDSSNEIIRKKNVNKNFLNISFVKIVIKGNKLQYRFN